MTVGAGVGVGDRLEIHHVLPEIGRLDARQELLRRVVHARIAPMRRRRGARGGRSERAEGYADDEDDPRRRPPRAQTKWQENLPPRSGSQEVEAAVLPPAAPGGGTGDGLMPNRRRGETRPIRAPPTGVTHRTTARRWCGPVARSSRVSTASPPPATSGPGSWPTNS